MKPINEYAVGVGGKDVDMKQLESGFIPDEIWGLACSGLIISCHDVYIQYPNSKNQQGLLLVHRNQKPVKGVLWPIGGRILRGVPMEQSIRQKAKQECGLDLENLSYLGVARVSWDENSLGNGKGYDSFGFNYFARGIGEIQLDDFHEQPRIITPEKYTPQFQRNLHPYVREFMDKAINILKQNIGKEII